LSNFAHNYLAADRLDFVSVTVRNVARNLIWVGINVNYSLIDIEFILGQGDKTTT